MFTMETYITKTSSSSFYNLYNIRSIPKYLPKHHTETLIHAFILQAGLIIVIVSSVHVYGLPDYKIHKLQRGQNACARMVCNESKFCHITPLSMNLHWLPFTCTFKVLNGLSPSYLTSLITYKGRGHHTNFMLPDRAHVCVYIHCKSCKNRIRVRARPNPTYRPGLLLSLHEVYKN